jgi:pyruvate kinase
MDRRAKIVCTLGPATAAPERVRDLVEAGMDVARLNFSHGDHETHRATYEAVRAASDASKRAVGVLADLQGPKIRLGAFADGGVTLETGAEFRITTAPLLGDAHRASTTYAGLARDVRPGDQVRDTDGRELTCVVVEGGPVSDHKGLNLPGAKLGVEPLTEKDVEDLEFALTLRVDMVALSFVRRPEDVARVREILARAKAPLTVLAKIEKPEAVERLPQIVEAFDGIMVARGDLGVETPLEHVPLVQKKAIRLARAAAKPVIVATQMLDSMITHAMPTRAEASDVVNAVFDGADALMLSGETSVGAHPIEAVETMARLIRAAEENPAPPTELRRQRSADQQEAMARAAVALARDLGARAIVTPTTRGLTARFVAACREPIRQLAFTPDPLVRSQLALVWGCETFVVPETHDTDTMVHQVDEAAIQAGRGVPGDLVVIVAGLPPGRVGNTNTLRVHRLGEPIRR